MRETFPYKAGVILTLSQLSLTVSLFTNIHTMYSYIIGKFTLTLNGYITHIQMKVNLIIYLIPHFLGEVMDSSVQCFLPSFVLPAY